MIRDDGRTREPVEGAIFLQRLEELKGTVADLEEQLGDVRRRIDRAAHRRRLTRHAAVAPSRCTGCGVCEELCPQGAVRVSRVATIDVERCIGCGVCVQYCPQGAIRLSEEP